MQAIFFLWRVINKIKVENVTSSVSVIRRLIGGSKLWRPSQQLQTSVGINTTNMRTLMLLVLTIVAVTGLHTAKNKVLQEINRNVETLLKHSSSEVRTEMNYFIWFSWAKQWLFFLLKQPSNFLSQILNQFVKDVIPSVGCSVSWILYHRTYFPNTWFHYLIIAYGYTGGAPLPSSTGYDEHTYKNNLHAKKATVCLFKGKSSHNNHLLN